MSGKAMDIIKPDSGKDKFDQAVNNFKAQYVAGTQGRRKVSINDSLIDQHLVLFQANVDLDQALNQLLRELLVADLTPKVSTALGQLHDAAEGLKQYVDFIERTQP